MWKTGRDLVYHSPKVGAVPPGSGCAGKDSPDIQTGSAGHHKVQTLINGFLNNDLVTNTHVFKSSLTVFF